MNNPLRTCPTCGTKVADTDGGLGLRDYRWVAPSLPGRVSPSDLDSVLEKNGHFLVMEYKPQGVALSMGQRILLKQLVRKGFDVWVVWGEGPVEVGPMDRYGDVKFVDEMTTEGLAKQVSSWYAQAEKEKS